MKLNKPGSDVLHWAVVVQCEGHEPTIEDWAETSYEAEAKARCILKDASEERWGHTIVWVVNVHSQGEVK